MSWKQLLSDIQERLFGFDNLFVRTSTDLLLRPGRVIDTLFAGNRRRYMGAGAYLLLTITVLLLLLELLGTTMLEFYGMEVLEKPSDRGAAIGAEINRFIYANYRLITFLMIPLYAMLSMLFFRKSGYNFVEHAVIYCYIHAYSAWFLVPLLFLNHFFAIPGFLLSSLLALLYAFWFNLQVFRYQAGGWVLLKALLVQLLSLVFFSILGLVAALLLM